jgi:hypothetical protein
VSAQIKSYSEIKKKNIYDYSHTGGSKTTRAIEFIEHEISQRRPVIVIMLDYVTLETTYFNRFSSTVQSKSLVVKGKTQVGMCTHSGIYSKLHMYVQPPNECPSCPELNSCKYQKQKRELNTLITSASDGFVILTTPRMLDSILKQCNGHQPSIIIDDVPISQVITDEISDTEKNLKDVITESRAFNCEKIPDVAKKLLEKKSSDEIFVFIHENKVALKGELNKIQGMINSLFTGSEEFAKYDSIFGLQHAISCDTSIDIYYDEHGIFGVLKIFSTKKNLQKYRILYLNASCNYIDEYYLNQLDDLERICVESGNNPQFTVYQLVDAKYSRSTIKDSTVIVEKVTTICNTFNQLIIDLGMKVPFFTHDKSYETKFKPDARFQRINHSFVKFYGSKTRGTNEFLTVPISVIVGTPFLPASYFMHPAFKGEFKKASEIEEEVNERDRRKKAGQYAPPVYPVKTTITERCAVEQLIQVIGRTLRVDPNNPSQEKFVILFSKLDDQEAFEKECTTQNGAKILTYHYERLPDKNKFFLALGKAILVVFRPVLISTTSKLLDQELAQGDVVKLGDFTQMRAKEFHEVISYKTLEREISRAYVIEERPIGKNGKNVRVIVKKMSV